MKFLEKLFGRTPPLVGDVAGMSLPPGRLEALQLSDQFLISYPRSGNTWARHLLREVIVLSSGLPAPEELWMLIPDLHVHPMDHPARAQFGMPGRIFKSHNLRDLVDRRFVYIFRQATDALVSYYHFHLREKIQPELTAEGPDAFCSVMLPGWSEHMQLAIKAARARPSEVLLVSYEMLHAQGVPSLAAMANFFGLCSREAVLTEALKKAEFSKLRAREGANPTHPDEFFFRRGHPGTGKEELAPATCEAIEAETRHLYQEASQL